MYFNHFHYKYLFIFSGRMQQNVSKSCEKYFIIFYSTILKILFINEFLKSIICDIYINVNKYIRKWEFMKRNQINVTSHIFPLMSFSTFIIVLTHLLRDNAWHLFHVVCQFQCITCHIVLKIRDTFIDTN